MKKQTSTPTTPDPVPAPAPPQLNPVAALAALGNPTRWAAWKMLANGQGLPATAVASALQQDFDGVSKHMHILRAAGLVTWRRGDDRRQAIYYIPAANRPEPGVVDYGFCRLRLPPA